MDGSRHAVAIVGGGPAGCATAIALASRGVQDVVVIDMQREPGWRIGEAIPPAGRHVLNRLGVWEDFLAQGHLPSAGSCAAWGKPDLGYNDFLLDMQGKGWHLDRAAFDTMLSAAVSGRGGTLIRGLACARPNATMTASIVCPSKAKTAPAPRHGRFPGRCDRHRGGRGAPARCRAQRDRLSRRRVRRLRSGRGGCRSLTNSA